MEFEWGDAKSDANFESGGFDFEFAARIFEGIVWTVEDVRRDCGEDHFQSIGVVGGLTLFVVHTSRGGVTRIMSARLANRKERRLWLSFASL